MDLTPGPSPDHTTKTPSPRRGVAEDLTPGPCPDHTTKTPSPRREVAEDLDGLLADAFWHLLRFVLPERNAEGEVEGLTLSQGRIMRSLSDEGPLPMSVVASIAGVSRATATGIVDRLVARRLVRRYADESDRRTILVELLSGGRVAVDEGRARLQEKLRRVIVHLDPEEQEQLRGTLGSLARALQEESGRVPANGRRPE